MPDYLVTDTELTNVANAIRTKAGLSVTLEFPSEFVSAIANIPTGGGASSVNVTITDPDGIILQIYKPTTATESLVYPTFSLTAPANSMLTMYCGLNPTINSITNATYDIATAGSRPMQYMMMLYLTDQDATLSISMM